MSDQPVAIVTGSSRGIGRAIASKLASIGHAVTINYNSSREAAEVAVQAIEAQGGKAIAVKGNVGNSEDRQRMISETLAQFGRLDVLVNNAGITSPGRLDLLDATEENWDLVLDTNLKSHFLASQAVGRYMVEQKYGKIINISSTFGLVGFENRTAYAASKGGIGQLTKVLAIEWGPYNVRVNAIAPTATRTTINEELFANEDWQKWMLERLPVKKFAMPVDMVGAAIFLASDASGMVTGITLPVDGGWTAW